MVAITSDGYSWFGSPRPVSANWVGIAVLEEAYNEHCVGWDTHLARLGEYVTRLVSTP
jgi:hypothetical protein